MELPVIGKTYHYFDDGKIRENRKLNVKITDIIPFDKIDDETLTLWYEEIIQCDWLYSEETDLFIKGELELSQGKKELIVFVRTKDNSWFSLGWWGGRLDVDGSLNNYLVENSI